MLGACHDWAMANLQVKNLPDSDRWAEHSSGLADGRERQRYDLAGQHSHRDWRCPHPHGRVSHPYGDLPLRTVTAVTPMREALLRMETAAILTGESPIQVRKAPIRIGTAAIPGCDALL